MTKTVKLYQIRVYTGNEHSRPVNYTQRLRGRSRALRLAKRLKGRYGMDVFCAPMRVSI